MINFPQLTNKTAVPVAIDLNMKHWPIKRIYILIIVCSVILQVLISPIRGYVDIFTAMVVGYAVYSLYTLFISRMFSARISLERAAICVIVGICILQVPIRVHLFKSTLLSLPDMVMHLFGVLSAYFFLRFGDARRWAFPLLLFSAMLFTVVKGYDLWANIVNFGSLTGRITGESREKTSDFGVSVYPTTILMDKNRKILFRGPLSAAEKFLESR